MCLRRNLLINSAMLVSAIAMTNDTLLEVASTSIIIGFGKNGGQRTVTLATVQKPVLPSTPPKARKCLKQVQ